MDTKNSQTAKAKQNFLRRVNDDEWKRASRMEDDTVRRLEYGITRTVKNSPKPFFALSLRLTKDFLININ